MGMSLGSGHDDRPQPVVNVTPLVDVALVVLIIFMVVTPMMMKTFWLNIPQKNEEEAKTAKPKDSEAKPLVMTVDREGVIRVNKVVITRAEFAERLPRMLAAAKQRVLYFDAHDDVPYGTAVELMDRARAGGARTIALLTESVVH